MANRKQPETGPILDSVSDADKRKDSLVLPDHHFKSVIRGLKTGSLDRANVLKGACETHLKRMGKKPDLSKAVKGIPEGSNQGDAQSIIRWMEKIGRHQRKAVNQIIAIHATAAARSS